VLSWVLLGPSAGRLGESCPALYRLFPGRCGASREQSCEHQGFRSLIVDASGAPSSATTDRIGRPGTARPILSHDPLHPMQIRPTPYARSVVRVQRNDRLGVARD
jgi:hypothetical protein